MKKTYIISFLLFLALIFIAYITGYYMMKGEEGKQELSDTEKLEEVTSDTGKYTTDQTIYILENYNVCRNQLTQEKLPMPAEYVGCTREELQKKIQTYIHCPSQEDVERGLKDFTMICFSPNKLVLRKTYQNTETDMVYQVRQDENGNIMIYYADTGELYTETDISYSSLPFEIQKQINAEVKLYGLKEVYDFLENYSS